MAVHLFGIRHHGPGSARSLLAALEALSPDLVLIEGPSEAEPILAHAADPAMQPPVAMLVYDPEQPKRCAFYPFALFSPEWQAIQFAARRGAPTRFIDLPQTHQLALEAAAEEARMKAAEPQAEPAETDESAATETEYEASDDASLELRRDPLAWLAQCAGYSDGERWWEHLIEERREGDGVFAAIREAMTALREELKAGEIPRDSEREAKREAWMRKTIRAAEKEGFERIAVVCGAWHVPALADGVSSAKEDAKILAGLPKTKVAATWIPWTYWRLASASGYGAGIKSPGWYDFLWSHREGAEPERLATTWIARAARLLRSKDLDASTASVIEAVRLSSSLAAIRGRALPDLAEMTEAIRSVFLMGEDAALRLIEERLIIGERLGEVPESVPAVPIQQDLARLQKSLRLPPTADPKDYDFDLRKPNDLDRSRLLHRLALLGVPWGRLAEGASRSKGTFRESWRLEWKPELAIDLIESAAWGNTVESAAAGFALGRAKEARTLADLTSLLRAVLLADLAAVIPGLMRRLESEAAATGDIPQMMDAVAPLAEIARYGDVRGTAASMVVRVLNGLVERVCIGLGAACGSLDDDAAGAMVERVNSVDAALALIESAELIADWRAALLRLAGRSDVHGLLLGRSARILFDAGALDAADAAKRLSVALSRGNDPAAAGAWIEGFLQGSGMILLHSDELWRIMDAWVCSLQDAAFDATLPLLRRTFATFPQPERRMMGERLRRAGSAPSASASRAAAPAIAAHARADQTLPIILKILGLEDDAP